MRHLRPSPTSKVVTLITQEIKSDSLEKGVFCDECDTLNKRYCFEKRCDRSHFCFMTATASGCGYPSLYTMKDCRAMYGGDCCYARKDIYAERFNASACKQDIPDTMCHKCTRMGGCTPVGCPTGTLCYANKFESGCANTSDMDKCERENDRCCIGDTSIIPWNATQCQVETAPTCQICDSSKSSPLEGLNCSYVRCPGLCYLSKLNETSYDATNNINRTNVVTRSGCSKKTDLLSCTNEYGLCCNADNATLCAYNGTIKSYLNYLLLLLLVSVF